MWYETSLLWFQPGTYVACHSWCFRCPFFISWLECHRNNHSKRHRSHIKVWESTTSICDRSSFAAPEEAACDLLHFLLSCIVGNVAPGVRRLFTGLALPTPITLLGSLKSTEISPVLFHIVFPFSKPDTYITHNATFKTKHIVPVNLITWDVTRPDINYSPRAATQLSVPMWSLSCYMINIMHYIIQVLLLLLLGICYQQLLRTSFVFFCFFF